MCLHFYSSLAGKSGGRGRAGFEHSYHKPPPVTPLAPSGTSTGLFWSSSWPLLHIPELERAPVGATRAPVSPLSWFWSLHTKLATAEATFLGELWPGADLAFPESAYVCRVAVNLREMTQACRGAEVTVQGSVCDTTMTWSGLAIISEATAVTSSSQLLGPRNRIGVGCCKRSSCCPYLTIYSPSNKSLRTFHQTSQF